MNSSSVQFYYQSLSADIQKEDVRTILYTILYQTEDQVVKKALFSGLVEEVLTKRPYSKALISSFLDDPSYNDGK